MHTLPDYAGWYSGISLCVWNTVDAHTYMILIAYLSLIRNGRKSFPNGACIVKSHSGRPSKRILFSQFCSTYESSNASSYPHHHHPHHHLAGGRYTTNKRIAIKPMCSDFISFSHSFESHSRPSTNAPHQPHHPSPTMRQFCLVCGRMAKQAGSSAFYSIHSTLAPSDGLGGLGSGGGTIAHRLRDILRVELPRKKLVPSEDICKKCFRQLNEVDYLEIQVRVAFGGS